jgi:hypothetical protein
MKPLIAAVLIVSLPFAAFSQTDIKSKFKSKSKPDTVVEQTRTSTHVGAPLTSAQAAIVPHVYTGQQACEAGVSVTLTPDANASGYFNVAVKNRMYHMYPVVTLSGAVRLEDPREGAIWLQMTNKSMMMNQKTGSRLADDCINPAQAAVALAMKSNATPGLLDTKK